MANAPYNHDEDPFFKYLNTPIPGEFGTQYGQLSNMFGQEQLDALIRGWSGYNGFANQPPPVAPTAAPRPPPQVNIPPAGGIFPGSIRGNNMYSNPQQFQPMQRQQMQFGNRGFGPPPQQQQMSFDPRQIGGIFNVSATPPYMQAQRPMQPQTGGAPMGVMANGRPTTPPPGGFINPTAAQLRSLGPMF